MTGLNIKRRKRMSKKTETIREWLNEDGFNWDKGVIIIQGVREKESCPGWATPISAQVITSDNPILDELFCADFGGPECPRFVAKDDIKIYFPSMYDGATWIESVFIDIKEYLVFNRNESPYFGRS
jgi:hypothetical protein